MSTSPTRTRRRYQFGLGTLMASITVAAVWLGWWVNIAHRQRNAVTAISADGGRVQYHYAQYDGRDEQVNESPIPQALIARLGVDFFHKTSKVWIYIPHEDVIAGCGDLPGLEELYLHDLDSVSDETWSQLARLRTLRGLALNTSRISDASLHGVRKLRRLEWLYLCCPRLTDDALASLTELGHLKSLGLVQTQITDAGLSTVCELSSLEQLTIEGPAISGDGLLKLQGLPKLKELTVLQTMVGDAAALQRALPNCELNLQP